MSTGLFLVRGEDTVKVLRPSSFASEDAFQRLVERFPELLTQLDGPASRKWILIKREAGIPDVQNGLDRWSLDHLFLDEEGVPTLVEIKRSTDTRTRREVVAQVLDYAANASRWWNVDKLQEWFLQAHSCDLDSAHSQLSVLLSRDGIDWDAYWRSVASNLSAGRLRLVIAADVIPPELERIIEFLNEQMNPASILALELRVFEDGSDRILAPRLVGATTRAEDQKSIRKEVALSVEDWLGKEGIGENERIFVERMSDLGARPVVAGQSLALDFGSTRFAYLRHRGRISLSMWGIKKHPHYVDDQQRSALLHAFELAGFKPSNSNHEGEPSLFIPAENEAAQWTALIAVFSNLFHQLA